MVVYATAVHPRLNANVNGLGVPRHVADGIGISNRSLGSLGRNLESET